MRVKYNHYNLLKVINHVSNAHNTISNILQSLYRHYQTSFLGMPFEWILMCNWSISNALLNNSFICGNVYWFNYRELLSGEATLSYDLLPRLTHTRTQQEAK